MNMHSAPIEPAAEDTSELVRQAEIQMHRITDLCHVIELATCTDIGDEEEADRARMAVLAVVHSIAREADEALELIERLE